MTRVLVTGAAGFLGGAVVARLLEAHPELEVVAAVREREGRSPDDRTLASVTRYLDTSRPSFARRLSTVPFDLAHASELPSSALAGVTHAVHLAVDVSGGRAANVDGTCALATRLRDGGITRLVYVGSAWSCGRVRRARVREDDPCAPEAVRPYLAEKLAVEAALAGLSGLPLVIARPSLVAGHSALGSVPSASLIWVLRVIDAVGTIPWSLQQRLDVVSVDWAAAAIDALLFTAVAPRVCHLSAGADASLRWADLEAVFARVDGRPRQWQQVATPTSEWAEEAVRRVLPRAPSLAGPLRDCLRFFEGDVVFDDGHARRVGLPPPPSWDACLELCLRRDRGRTLAQQAHDDV